MPKTTKKTFSVCVCVKCYLKDRAKYGVYYTMMPELDANDLLRWLHYTYDYRLNVKKTYQFTIPCKGV